ncbi:MAG: hypothetical protein JO189_05860 [Deltaproteobacteria bacterium]|nr:hypothetical protein [Deltaproteobacteria bacterium]
MALCIERNCIRPAADGFRCVIHRQVEERNRRIDRMLAGLGRHTCMCEHAAHPELPCICGAEDED